MKPLSTHEIDTLVLSAQRLIGATLSEIKTTENGVGLLFWKEGKLCWLWFMNVPSAPLFLILDEFPLPMKVIRTPMLLFLKAHAKGRELLAVGRDFQLGRVVKVMLGDEDGHCELELRLIPHAQNMMARTADKKISLKKIREIKPRNDTQNLEPSEVQRTSQELIEEFKVAIRKLKTGGHNPSTNLDIHREISKKKKIHDKISEDIKKKKLQQWAAVGEWIKAHQSLAVPENWIQYVDSSLSFSGNIENCFHRASQLKRKIAASHTRLQQLQGEIEKLNKIAETQISSGHESEKSIESRAPKFLKKDSGQALNLRKIELRPDLFAYVGRSAKENIHLIRQARPWHMWVHLKDLPSAHAIIVRNRGVIVTYQELISVGSVIIKQTFGKKSDSVQGQKFELLVCECRHVQPVKGDPVGRVRVQSAQTIAFKF